MSAKLSALGRVGKHNGFDLLLLRDMSMWDVFYRLSLSTHFGFICARLHHTATDGLRRRIACRMDWQQTAMM